MWGIRQGGLRRGSCIDALDACGELMPIEAQTQVVTDPSRSIARIQGETPALRLAEALWEMIGQRLFRVSFHNWYGLRRRILRMFGASIDPTARIRPTVKISHPWHLQVGAHTAIGDQVILYCLGPIRIGRRCTISQYAHLCAGGHDYTKKDMPLITDPIVLKDGVWIAADVFVGPGVTIGADTVVGARSTVFHSLPEKSVCAGDNAVRICERVFDESGGHKRKLRT